MRAENQVVPYVEGSLRKGMMEKGCIKGGEITFKQHSNT